MESRVRGVRSCGWVTGAAVMLLMLAVPSGRALAAPGDLDTSFGGGTGKVITDFGGSVANAVALQPDGKIVVVGRGGSGLVLARYNENGTPDTSFGDGDGVVTGSVPGTDVYLEPGGKIMVGGVTRISEDPEQDAAVLSRFNADGSIDTTYGGGDGTVTTAFGTSEDRALGSGFGPSGKFVVVGQQFGSREVGGIVLPTSDFAVAAYSADGSLDTGFGGGMIHTDLGTFHDQAYAVAVQSDGKVVVGGTSGGNDFTIVRYNPNGSLDTGFSADGKSITARYSFDEFIFGVTIQPDGKILAVGTAADGQAILRYNENGTPDTSFGGGDGVTLTDPEQAFGSDIETGAEAYAAVLEPSGRIAVVGNFYNFWTSPPFFPLTLTRYNPNGVLDHSFGDHGLTMIPGGFSGGFEDVAIQSDGKLVAVGGTGNPNNDFVVARFEGGGGPIPTYHRLSASKAGAGSGRVVGEGINCGPECSGDFEADEMAQLKAFPTEGSEFAGWSGACSGSGVCEVSMGSDLAVTASFAVAGKGPATEDGHHETGSGSSSGLTSATSSNPTTGVVLRATPKPTLHKHLKCHKGFRKQRVHGKVRCVRAKRRPQPH